MKRHEETLSYRPTKRSVKKIPEVSSPNVSDPFDLPGELLSLMDRIVVGGRKISTSFEQKYLTSKFDNNQLIDAYKSLIPGDKDVKNYESGYPLFDTSIFESFRKLENFEISLNLPVSYTLGSGLTCVYCEGPVTMSRTQDRSMDEGETVKVHCRSQGCGKNYEFRIR